MVCLNFSQKNELRRLDRNSLISLHIEFCGSPNISCHESSRWSAWLSFCLSTSAHAELLKKIPYFLMQIMARVTLGEYLFRTKAVVHEVDFVVRRCHKYAPDEQTLL